MFCVLLRLDTQDVVSRFFIGFGGGRQAMSGRSFRGKKQRCFPFWSGRKMAVKNTKQKSFAARGFSVPTVRSAAVLRSSIRWRQRRGYRRGWVSRPERTKYQSERGTCPLLATVWLQWQNTICGFRPHLPSLRNSTGILATPLSGILARHPIRSEWVRSPYGLQIFTLFSRRKFRL